MTTITQRKPALFPFNIAEVFHKGELILSLASVLTIDCLISSANLLFICHILDKTKPFIDLISIIIMSTLVPILFILNAAWQAYKKSNFSKNIWHHRVIALSVMALVIYLSPLYFQKIAYYSSASTRESAIIEFLGVGFITPMILMFLQRHILFRTDQQTQNYSLTSEKYDERQYQQAYMWQSKAYNLIVFSILAAPAAISYFTIVFEMIFPQAFASTTASLTYIMASNMNPVTKRALICIPLIHPLNSIARILPDFLAQWHHEKPLNYPHRTPTTSVA